jgi:hypothetical protein
LRNGRPEVLPEHAELARIPLGEHSLFQIVPHVQNGLL